MLFWKRISASRRAAAGAVAVLGGAVLAGPVLAGPVLAGQALAADAPSPDQRFAALADGEWQWRLAHHFADDSDTPGPLPDHLPDVSPAAQNAATAKWQATRAALAAIDPARLSPAAQVNYAVYRYQLDSLLVDQHFRVYEKPLNSDTTFWGELAGLAETHLRDEAQARHYIALLREIPAYFDQQIANMRAGAARGFTPPRVTLEGRDASLVPYTSADHNPYGAPLQALPASIAPASRAALQAEAAQVIARDVAPAHARLLAYLRADYIPHARRDLAATSLPDGRAFYQAQIRAYTTLDLTPEAIHAIGLAEVASIRTQMRAVMDEVGFKGELPAFLDQLRRDPRFYVTTPQALLDRAAWIAKTFDGKAPDWFGHLPRARFAIKPVPDEIAPFYTAGRGGSGIYLVNTWNLPARPLYALPALTLHESAPGHAFQMPLAAENTALPAWRAHSYISAYGEGWALYCEKLGVEMGMYATPYERFGMLSYQMWRAARLVVDTGIHAKGWSRAQALAFLHDNTALSDHEIETETDRYITWPGQALSYYLGERAIVAARARAEAALGPRFNIRAFHDLVLSLGSVPLPVLDAEVDRFIAGGGVGPYPEEEK